MDGRDLECTAAEKDIGAFVKEDLNKLKFEQRERLEREKQRKKAKKIAGMVTYYIQYKKT